MSASCFFGVNVFDLDLGVQINSGRQQPIKSNSVGPGNMSHRWTSAFHNHFYYSFIVLMHMHWGFLARGLNI